MRYKHIIFGAAMLALSACSADDNSSAEQTTTGPVQLTSSIENFIGEPATRVNTDGTAFEKGDLIRIKVICPYVTSTEYGESTWGNSFDAFWLQSWTGNAWGTVGSSYGFDINGDYGVSSGQSLIGQYLVQQTPYVFTASTWTEEKSFLVDSKVVMQYANVFHADQSHTACYKASDVLWAQNVMQTGTDEVHLDFHHVMSALKITVSGITLSENAVLTIAGMPDIDQAEIIVGDQYAEKSKVNSACGYKQKHACTAEQNGKVLGIGVNDASAGTSSTKAFTDIDQTATYKAYRPSTSEQTFQVIVPPCTLNTEAVINIYDTNEGTAVRWKGTLSQLTFEQETMYSLTLNLKQQSTEEEGNE